MQPVVKMAVIAEDVKGPPVHLLMFQASLEEIRWGEGVFKLPWENVGQHVQIRKAAATSLQYSHHIIVRKPVFLSCCSTFGRRLSQIAGTGAVLVIKNNNMHLNI